MNPVNILRFLRPVVYVRLRPDLLSIRDVGARHELNEPPVAAFSRGEKKKLLAVGQDARTVREPADVINPFTSLVGDSDKFEEAFNEGIRAIAAHAGKQFRRAVK